MIRAEQLPEPPFRHPAEICAVESSPLRRGRVLERTLAGDARQRYFLYLPNSYDGDSRVMVSIHGISRNAREQAEAFVTLAERHNLLLIAPLFGADRFTDYQRLGRAGKGPRADLALNRILREVTELSGVDSERFFLFGFSGGGQFAHRYAFAYPHRVAALVVGAAGWYTLPDPGRRYPHGTAAVAELPGIDFDPERYLRVPACVLVGEGDIQRDPELKRTGRLDREQGRNRVARGRSWIAAMRTAADRQGVQTRYHFDTLPGFGHSFLEGHRSERFCDCISRFLFAY